MITTIIKNISKTDRSEFGRKYQFLPQFLILTPNKLENRKGMVKMFWPFKTVSHTYTHTLPCILHEIWSFTRVLMHILPKWLGKWLKLLDISDLNALNEWGLMAHLPSDHCSLLGAFSKGDPLKM